MEFQDQYATGKQMLLQYNQHQNVSFDYLAKDRNKSFFLTRFSFFVASGLGLGLTISLLVVSSHCYRNIFLFLIFSLRVSLLFMVVVVCCILPASSLFTWFC